MSQVFAYGSLMGDAALARYPTRPARLPGYHRAFLHESRRRWGRPEAPCPILGLSPGGECWGLLFDVPDEDRARIMRALDKREAAAERRRETHTVETPDGPIPAVVWVSRKAEGGAEPREPGGPPAGRPRDGGQRLRVRAGAWCTPWSCTASGIRSSTRSGSACEADTMLLYITAEDVFGSDAPKGRGLARCTAFRRRWPASTTSACATTSARRPWPGPAERRPPVGAGLEAGPAGDPHRPARPREDGRRARHAGGGVRTPRLALAGRGFRRHGIRRSAGRDRARPAGHRGRRGPRGGRTAPDLRHRSGERGAAPEPGPRRRTRRRDRRRRGARARGPGPPSGAAPGRWAPFSTPRSVPSPSGPSPASTTHRAWPSGTPERKA